MNKRIRKKKHRGEFRQLGFSIEFRFRPGLSTDEFDQFIDDFITRGIESHGLTFGGGGSPDHGWSGIVCKDHRYRSTADADKAAVQSWLEQRSEVASVRVSAPWDVWHGSDPFEAS